MLITDGRANVFASFVAHSECQPQSRRWPRDDLAQFHFQLPLLSRCIGQVVQLLLKSLGAHDEKLALTGKQTQWQRVANLIVKLEQLLLDPLAL